MTDRNREYAERPASFADDTALQFTMREMQSIFANPRLWVGIGVASVVLAVIAPFNTDTVMNFPERLVFWSLQALATYATGSAFTIFFNAQTFSAIKNEWLRQLLGGLFAAIPITLIVWFINTVVFSFNLGGWNGFLQMFGIVAVISPAVSIIYRLISPAPRQETTPRTSASRTSPFIERLPKELGKNLLHISSEDHYVRAVTDRGSHMVLMRLSDAIAELEGIAGIQVHRSHWVAKNAAEEIIRENGRKMIRTIDGETFPISRSYSKSVDSFLK